jgi:hypothetical protein
LPNQKALLISELVIVCPVFQEFGKEFEEPLPIVDQDPLHRN